MKTRRTANGIVFSKCWVITNRRCIFGATELQLFEFDDEVKKIVDEEMNDSILSFSFRKWTLPCPSDSRMTE